MVYFDIWTNGSHVTAEDWYIDNLVYVNVRSYRTSTAIDRPDDEKSFLLRLDDPSRIRDYQHTIAECLSCCGEKRDELGLLIPIRLSLPA